MPRSMRLLLALVVLVVLVVGADRIAASLAARSVAGGLTVSQRLDGPASVRFPGFPFLTQAVRGRYDTVDVRLEGVPTASALVVDRIDATLHGVAAPLGSLARGTLTTLAVERGDAVAFVSFPALTAAAQSEAGRAAVLGSQLTDLTLGRASADRVQVAARVRTPLGTFSLRGQARLTVSGGTLGIRLVPDSIAGVPAALRSRVADLVDLGQLAPPLPYGFRATSVVVDPAGLRVGATGTNLALPA